MDCRSARELYIGSVGAPDGALADARAHVATCPACRERLDALGAAALSQDEDEISCAECLGRVSRSGSDEPVDAGHLDLIAARHLGVCPMCAAVVAELTPTLAALRADALAEPPHYPAVDTSFLPGPTPAATSPVATPEAAGRPLSWLLRWVVAAFLAMVALVSIWRGLVPASYPPQEASGVTVTPAPPSPATATAPPTAIATPLGEALPGRTPASTAPPAAASPTTPTRPPEATPRPPTPDDRPAPGTAGSIALLPPAVTDGTSGLLRLAWQAPALLPGTVFDVRVCSGADCRPAFGRTNVAEPVWLWCPDEGAGSYRWQVVVVDATSKQVVGPRSDIGSLDWAGGDCAEPPSTPPTPPPSPTPDGEPPPEP
jgi:hypothetical protein